MRVGATVVPVVRLVPAREVVMVVVGSGPVEAVPCRHDSSRRDGSLDSCCLRCGADGYWHFGHRHDRVHPGGKVLFVLGCSDAAEPERTREAVS